MQALLFANFMPDIVIDTVSDMVELAKKDPATVVDNIPGAGVVTRETIAAVDLVQGDIDGAMHEHANAQFNRLMDGLTYMTGGASRFLRLGSRAIPRAAMRLVIRLGLRAAPEAAEAALRGAVGVEEAAAKAAAKKAARVAAENSLGGQLERAGLTPLDTAINIGLGLRKVAQEQAEQVTPPEEEPPPEEPLEPEDRPSDGPLDLTRPQIPEGATPLVADTRLGDVNVNLGVDLDSLYRTVLDCRCPC